MAEITEDQVRDATEIGEGDLMTDVGPAARGVASGQSMPPVKPPGTVDPSPSGMQAPGVGASLAADLATGITDPGHMRGYNPATQGVTGMHGETGDPLARDIESTLVLGPMAKIAAMKFLGTETGKLGELAARGTRAPGAEAMEAATAEAGGMSRSAMSDLAELQAQQAEAEAVAAAREATRLGLPSGSVFHPFKAFADFSRMNAPRVAARTAPLATRAAESPLSTSAAALMFKRLGGQR